MSDSIKMVARPAPPYNHEAETLEESCGITRESYRRFCKYFEDTVGLVRQEKPVKRSREIEAFENLMLRCPREVGFYITRLTEDLAEADYLRSVLRDLLQAPREKSANEDVPEDSLERLECAGSA